MSLTLAQMASRVLRNCQIPEDSSDSSVTALADAKQYLNERANDIWSRRLWREYLVLGSYSVPANTQQISLSSIVVQSGFDTTANGRVGAFAEIAAIRNGSTPLLPQDASAINLIQADLWASTTSPIMFVTRGASGIFLLGTFATATTLSFFGKADFQDLADGETWIIPHGDQALIEGATGDMIRDNDRDDNRATIRYQAFDAEIQKLVDAAENQGANLKRIVPLMPWTSYGYQNAIDTSKTGIGIQII